MASRPPCWESGSDITCHPAKPTVSLFIQVAKCVPCIFPLFELYFLRPDISCHQEPPRCAVGKICVRQNVTEFIHRSGKKDTNQNVGGLTTTATAVGKIYTIFNAMKWNQNQFGLRWILEGESIAKCGNWCGKCGYYAMCKANRVCDWVTSVIEFSY